MKIVSSDIVGLDEAARVLLSGGVAVIPTDTVYGLAAHPSFPEAVSRLYSLKGRAEDKPIALLASDLGAVEKFFGPLEVQAKRLALRYWPGALTLVLPMADGRNEGVRIPDHKFTRELLQQCGGVLRVTSANLSGEDPACSVSLSGDIVVNSVDIAVDDGPSPGGASSTVLKCAEGRIELLREGPVALTVLASASPRRAKILRERGVDFVVVKSGAAEVCYHDDPRRTVRENAFAKGESVRSSGHVIAADTIVWFNGKIYGKPRDLDEARTFLRELSGNVHSVFTGVYFDGEVKTVRTDVAFRSLTDEEIDEYIEKVKPLDRAGAYDIDEHGASIVDSHGGDYENIMGLPLGPLREWGVIA